MLRSWIRYYCKINIEGSDLVKTINILLHPDVGQNCSLNEVQIFYKLEQSILLQLYVSYQ